RAAGHGLEHAPLAAVAADGDDDEALAAATVGADWVLTPSMSRGITSAILVSARRVSGARAYARALETALAHVSDSVEVTDDDGHLEYVNRAFEQKTGQSMEECRGKTPAQLLRSHVHGASFYQAMWQTVSSKQTWNGSLVAKRSDNALVSQVATVVPVLGLAGEIDRIVAVKQWLPDALDPASVATQDALTEHVRASISAVLASEKRYRTMLESAGDAILVVDFESGFCLEANPAAHEMFGYNAEEFRRLTGGILANPDDATSVASIAAQLRATGQATEPRQRLQRKTGSRFWGAVQLTVYELMGRRQYIAVVRDVTAQVEREHDLERTNRQLEEMQRQLLHSNRLAALGHLAAGVAHEINNPLQFILSGLEELEPTLHTAPDGLRTAHADMREGVARIKLVTQSLLPFARVDAAQEAELVDLREIVEWACRVTANEIRHRARLDLRLGAVPAILAHQIRIGQLVTNLLTNAADAIEEGFAERNVITVSTSFIDERVRLRVEDTGCGIREEVRDRIFDPYFTTKSRDVGTGLGLAVCQEIVARAQGTIGFETEVGKGTAFLVTFMPAAAGTTTQQRPTDTRQHAAGARVLVVDDEVAILRILRRYLPDCDVVTALGGAAALEHLRADSNFDAIVCDLMMPNVDGPMVYASVRALHPGLEAKIIFCTGGAFTDRVRLFLGALPNLVIEKPVSAQDVREAVASVCSGLE
ncbi:MAG: PAS domain S-box protein, partial [Proteobacteria bacterium]|nr:PAS domain S-box protein [Pseudomonadota bacterium]